MLELLRNYAVGIGQLLLIYAALLRSSSGCAPPSADSRCARRWFNVEYLVVYQLINLAVAAAADGARGRPPARDVSGERSA